MDDVAEAAGVTKPVLYQHFPSKRALYRELLEDVGERLVAAITAAADADSGREQVHQLVSANESDPAAGKLSVESPLAQALAGAREGDEVAFQAPRGARRLLVVSVA
jgi:AcrR family transcriptional regulator